jgi:PPOX class probable F420-dependent enzyme
MGSTDAPNFARRMPGRNQRGLVAMSPEEVQAFLEGRHTLRMSTLRPDGSIHSVAMWYGFLDGCVSVETKAKSQKVANLRRDPRITCLIDDGRTYGELRGVELRGTAELIDDRDSLLRLADSLMTRYEAVPSGVRADLLERTVRNRVGIKVHIDHMTSWDHRKLGLE